jgi:hypothetical protein
MAVTDPITDLEGIVASDLLGRFFADAEYSVLSGDTTYCISVTGSATSAAPRGSDVAGVGRSMNQDGDIFDAAACAGNVVN